MKKGDLVMSKDKSVVGVVIEFSYMMRNVTIAVVWNDPPSAQGCKYFTLHNDNVILVPQGTVFKTKTKECEYMRYDSVTGIIHGVGEYISVVDNVITDVIFKDDIETDWTLIFDVTKDKKGFEKLYTELVLYHVLQYCKDKDVNRLKKIEKALEDLYEEVKKTEI